MEHILGKPTHEGKVQGRRKWKSQKGIAEMIKRIIKEWCHDKKALRKLLSKLLCRRWDLHFWKQQNVCPLVNGKTKCGMSIQRNAIRQQKGVKYWSRLRHRWTSKALRYVKWRSQTPETSVWFHVYAISKMSKSTDTGRDSWWRGARVSITGGGGDEMRRRTTVDKKTSEWEEESLLWGRMGVDPDGLGKGSGAEAHHAWGIRFSELYRNDILRVKG